VLNGLSWNPTEGGFLSLFMPGVLSGFGPDVPASAEVDGTGTIQGFDTFGFNEGQGIMMAFGPTGNPVPSIVAGLTMGWTEGNPGNSLGSVPSTQGMIANASGGPLTVRTITIPPAGTATDTRELHVGDIVTYTAAGDAVLTGATLY